MMEMVSIWPMGAGVLASVGLLGGLYMLRMRAATKSRASQASQRARAVGKSAGPAPAKAVGKAAATGKAYPPKFGKRASPEEHLDTIADWEPLSTRVLNGSQREAYHVLRKALPDHMILGQVPVARFIKVPTEHSYSEWLRRVGSLCADLVVCDMASQVVAVVEIRQTASHEKERTQKRQARMDRVLSAARIPVHVWLEGALPGPAVAREAILGAAIASTGRSGYADVNVARRDAEAAAVVASMQSPSGHMHGLMVDESPVDFNLNDWSQEEDSAEAQRKEPPPSTWFDDLDSEHAGLDEIGHASQPNVTSVR